MISYYVVFSSLARDSDGFAGVLKIGLFPTRAYQRRY